MTIQESDNRLGELILYICRKSADDIFFGSVKLNKLLYYSDFRAYARLGTTITGADYWNLPEGPAPVRLVQVRKHLLESTPQSLAIEIVEFSSGHTQKRPVSLRPANWSLFRGDQLAIVEEVITENRGLSARDISRKSHQEWGWKLTKTKDIIDPASIFLSPDELTEEEIELALSLAATV